MSDCFFGERHSVFAPELPSLWPIRGGKHRFNGLFRRSAIVDPGGAIREYLPDRTDLRYKFWFQEAS